MAKRVSQPARFSAQHAFLISKPPKQTSCFRWAARSKKGRTLEFNFLHQIVKLFQIRIFLFKRRWVLRLRYLRFRLHRLTSLDPLSHSLSPHHRVMYLRESRSKKRRSRRCRWRNSWSKVGTCNSATGWSTWEIGKNRSRNTHKLKMLNFLQVLSQALKTRRNRWSRTSFEKINSYFLNTREPGRMQRMLTWNNNLSFQTNSRRLEIWVRFLPQFPTSQLQLTRVCRKEIRLELPKWVSPRLLSASCRSCCFAVRLFSRERSVIAISRETIIQPKISITAKLIHSWKNNLRPLQVVGSSPTWLHPSLSRGSAPKDLKMRAGRETADWRATWTVVV